MSVVIASAVFWADWPHAADTTFEVRAESSRAWVSAEMEIVPARESRVVGTGTITALRPTLPSITLPATSAGLDDQTSRWTITLHRTGRKQIVSTVLADFPLPVSFEPSTTWADVKIHKNGKQPLRDTSVYTKTETDTRIALAAGNLNRAAIDVLGRIETATTPADPLHPKAVLDEDPRVGGVSGSYTKAQMLALPLPATGEMVNVTDDVRGMWRYNGTKWTKVEPYVSDADFGVLNNGVAQSTTNLQAALTAAATSDEIHTVRLRNGNYRFNSGSLIIPRHVTLQGSWEVGMSHTGLIDFGTGTSAARFDQPLPDDGKGTTILIDTGSGTSTGAFILVKLNAAIRGISFYYPSQPQQAASPTAYPWTIQTDGDSATGATGYNITLENLEFVNSYQAIYAHAGGRILIRNIFGQPLFGGIYMDKVYDSSRIENVQWTLSWSSPMVGGAYMNIFNWGLANGAYGFKLGRVDNLFITRCFVLGTNYGIWFADTADEAYGPLTLSGGGPWVTVSDSGFGDGGVIGAYFTAGGTRTLGADSIIRVKFSNVDLAPNPTWAAAAGVATTYGIFVTPRCNADIQIVNSHFGAVGEHYGIFIGGSPTLTMTGSTFTQWSAYALNVNFVNDPALSPFSTFPPILAIAGNHFLGTGLNALKLEGAGGVTGVVSGNTFAGAHSTALLNTSPFTVIESGNRFADGESYFGLIGGGRVVMGQDGNILLGPPVGSPLAVSATTGGLLYIPSMAGTPTGTPGETTSHVPFVYDKTNKKFCVYDGGAWRCTAAF